MMPVLAMGRDTPNGRLRLADGGLQLDWSAEPSRAYYEGVRRSLEQLAQQLGGKLVETGLAKLHRAITVHPVGGCAMAEDPRLGVVDPSGRVFGHPRLWIADGSVMPGPVGPNPSFTIAALADRFADAMLGAAP
jgi:cholesterol oxidase